MLRKRLGRRVAARKSRFAAVASKVRIEALEQRIMLTAVSTLPGPVLPTAPTPLQGVVSIPTSMGPQLFDNSFGFSNIYFQSGGNIIKGNGAGQTIAIVDAYGSPTIVNDAKTFNNFWGLSNNDASGQFFLTVQPLSPTVHTIQDSATVVADWSGETSLDVEWAHAVAPGAHILLVEAPSQDPFDMLDADVFAAQQPGVVVVSNSFGYPYNSTNPELTSFFQGEPDIYDGFFVTPTGHLDSDGLPGGVVFMASSGDQFGSFNFPAGSINVVSVGGMSVATDLNGNVNTIGTWNNPLGGSGGADDTHYNPTYHEPLVSLDADPLTGVWVYDSSPGLGGGVGWNVIGGTSLACPAWAAYTAIIDQGLALKGMASLNSQASNQFGTENNFQWQVLTGGELGVTYTINNQTFTGSLVGSIFEGIYPAGTKWPLYPNDGAVTNGQPSFVPTGNAGEPDFGSIPNNGNTGFGLPIGPSFANYVLDEDWVQAETLQNPVIPNTTQNITNAAELANVQQWANLALSLSIDNTSNPVVDPAAIPADFLRFVEQPTATGAGQTMATFQIEALNPFTSQVDASFNGPISISLGSGAGTSLIGTTTVNAVNGVATFSNLSIQQEGDYDIFATSAGKTPVVSNDFSITVGPATAAQLSVVQEPSAAWQFGTMLPIQVSVLDRFGNIVPGDRSDIGVSIASGPAGTVFGGNLLEPTVNGTATFGDLSLNLPGTYTFKFTDGALTSTVSANFQIVPIPVRQRFTLNGAPLSLPSILVQQQRNAIVFTVNGPPTAAQIALAQAAEASAAAADTLFAGGFVVETAAVPAATFANTGSISSDTSSVLDASGSTDKLLN